MRQELKTTEVESAGELSSAHFGISTNDQAHIIGILRDRLYSDKIMAVIREYTANAWDAHKENNCQQPIKVVLPSKFNPILRIRDFGPGISEEDIYDVYCKYGSSTKRDSNKAVGMLGIGCKSGFAYSDVFTIVSHNNGMKKTYTAFIDDTNMGQMSKLGEVPTDETGIEIQIPVSIDDIPYFKNKAVSLFQYMNPRPDVNVTIPERKYSVTGTGWKIREIFEGGPVAIMGTIGYPIKTERLDAIPERLKSLLTSSVDFMFPIGAVDISASREDLEYTKKTSDAIRTALEICQEELQVNLIKRLDAAENVWEARKIFAAACGNGQYKWVQSSRIQNITWTIAQPMRFWQGHDLSKTHFEACYRDEELEVRLLTSHSDKSLGKSSNSYRTQATYSAGAVVAMVDVKAGWVARAIVLRDKMKQEKKAVGSILLVTYRGKNIADSEAAYKRYLKSKGLDGITSYNLSDYALPAAAAAAISQAVDRSKKTSKKVFQMKAEEFSYSCSAPSSNWEATTVDLENGSGIYMPIHKFKQFVDGKFTSNTELYTMLGNLKAINVDLKTLKVIGVKPAEVSKVGDKWTLFGDWYAKKILDFVSSVKNAKELIETQSILREIHREQRAPYNVRAKSFEGHLPADHPLVCFFSNIFNKLEKLSTQTEAEKKAIVILEGAISNLPDDKKPRISYSVEATKKNLISKYPMLEADTTLFRVPYLRSWQKKNDKVGELPAAQVKRISDYIKLIDAQGTKS